MKKKIFFSFLIVIILSTAVVFGAFKFYETMTFKGKSANVKYESSFISYQDSTYSDYRTDMAYKVTFTLKTGEKYSQTEDSTYVANKTYYSKSDDTYEIVSASTYTIGNDITSTLYEKSQTYVGCTSVDSIITKSTTLEKDKNYSISTENELITSVSINVSSKNTLTLSKITCDDSGINSIESSDSNYKLVIDASFMSVIVLDNTVENSYTVIKTSDDEAKNATNVIATATEKQFDGESNIHLNQLGIKVDITTEIACYVRINIQDAWIRTRKYATNNQIKYITKDQIDGESPFKQSGSDYYYDSQTNIIYLKNVIKPELKEDGTFETLSFIFNVNEGYYYNSVNNGVYEDFIKVELAYNVDIVQANRVNEVWGLDPSKLN